MKIDPAESAKWLAEGDKLSAHAIFPLVGKNLRTVQQWFTDGMPHAVEERRGQPVRITTMRVVREWARIRGIALRAPAASQTAEQKAEAEAGGPLLVQAVTEFDARLAQAVGDFEAKVAAEVERRLASLVGDPDYDGRIVKFRQALESAFEMLNGVGDKALTAAEVGTASTALKNTSHELRQLEQHAREERVRRGDLIDRRAVDRTLTALTDVIANHRDALPPTIGREVSGAVLSALAGVEGVTESVGDRAGRAALASAQVATAAMFDKLATAIGGATRRGPAEVEESPSDLGDET